MRFTLDSLLASPCCIRNLAHGRRGRADRLRWTCDAYQELRHCNAGSVHMLHIAHSFTAALQVDIDSVPLPLARSGKSMHESKASAR